MANFKEQTVKLLRQQTNKLKNTAKELEVKDQQIKFLKETIKTLEEQREQLLSSNQQLRKKMKNMLAEVSAYNTNVIQRIYEENNALVEEVNSLKNKLEEKCLQSKQNINKYKQYENKQETMLTELCELKSSEQLLTEQLKKVRSRRDHLDEENRKLQNIQVQLSAKNEHLSSKMNSLQQQIDILTQKYQQNVDIAEKKYQNIMKKKVDKEQYRKIQDKIKNTQNQHHKLNQQNNQMKRQYDKLKLQHNKIKESMINSELKHKMSMSLIETDIRNFEQCFNLKKKVLQFESVFSNYLYSSYECYQKSVQIYEKDMSQLESLRQKIEYLMNKLSVCEQQLGLKQTEIQVLVSKHHQQMECLQGSYEGKLLQLSMRVKNEQYSLLELRGISQQSEVLHKAHDKLMKQHINLQQSSQHTIERLSEQNHRLVQQMQQVIQMCEDNIYNKNTINGVRHIVNELLVVIYYLHLLMMRSRQKNRKLFAPFIQYHTLLHNRLRQYKPRMAIYKFRSCAWLIISIIRMRRYKSNSTKGLLYYAQKAVITRDKISSMSTHLQKLFHIIMNTADNTLETLIAVSSNVYSWNHVKNYCRINLHPNNDIAMLQS